MSDEIYLPSTLRLLVVMVCLFWGLMAFIGVLYLPEFRVWLWPLSIGLGFVAALFASIEAFYDLKGE